MLEKLSIRNIGLVAKVDIDFGSGFTAFSGETGAGKSMILSSLLILLGSKIHAQTIRHGEERGEICTQWNIEEMSHVRQWLSEKDIEYEDVLVLRCVLSIKKKKQCFIQGALVTGVQLAQCMNLLCEVHAQHEHQRLFKSREQCKILDSYAGLTTRQEQFSKDLFRYRKKKEQWQKLCESEETYKKEIQYLRFVVNEIEQANISLGEYERVNEELLRQSHAQTIARLVSEVKQCVHGDLSMHSLYGKVTQALIQLQKYNAYVADITKRIDSAMMEISDGVQELTALYNQNTQESHADISILEDRLATLELLKKKYGGSIEHVITFLNEAREKLHADDKFHEDKDIMFRELKEDSIYLMQEADALHEVRVEASDVFSNEVNEILHTLAMDTADFSVRVPNIASQGRTLSAWGYDDISFVIRNNTGEPYMRISESASGGELSRIMLAIRIVSKVEGRTETLILDEVDAGIGGKTAVQVAHYLAKLVHDTQIICITHLPVIAAAAQFHYYVNKKQKENRTFVSVQSVSSDTRLQEIARMLVGDKHDTLAHNQARNLLQSFHNNSSTSTTIEQVEVRNNL